MMHLLGQPFTILGYTMLPLLHCNCERGGVVSPVMQQRAAGSISTQEPCPSCGRMFTIAGIGVVDGVLQIQVAMSVPQELITQ